MSPFKNGNESLSIIRKKEKWKQLQKESKHGDGEKKERNFLKNKEGKIICRKNQELKGKKTLAERTGEGNVQKK